MSIDELDMNNNLKSINRKTQVDQKMVDNSIDLIFRGNYKLNFQERLEDKDLLLLCSAINTLDNSIFENFRHIDLSYNNLTDSSIVEFINLLRKCPYMYIPIKY